MNLRNIKTALFLCLGILATTAMVSCEDDLEFREPIGTDTTVPGKVTNVGVENMAGKAKITYSLPDVKDLLYVKAVYELASGKSNEVTSSYYSNSILVEGFADTVAHEVKIYAVSRSNVSSEPVSVTVKPLEAPIWKVFKSLQIANAFGGYNLSAANTDADNVSIIIMKKNVFREFEVDNQKSVFTSTKNILSKIRGMDTLTHEFKVFVKDKWGNSTDTSTHTIKPLFEAELPKSAFRALVLPGDAPQVTNGARLEYAWDGRLGWPWVSFTNQFTGGSDPHMITFDTGRLSKLSRLWIRAFPEWVPTEQFYYLTTMKKFEVYGSENPSLSGALDESWVLLGSYEVVKQSGTPYGQDTPEDRQRGAAGFNWELDLDAPKVRYIRIRCLENFAGGTAQSINELSVYGDTRD
ncbi:DUF4959 domain-containing protein [Pontibacter sp. E15-1]|uniref:DUF4959 domain-containing protein n=1 Tax=Pontibacter sp. E15-1 TaxID=2919918 RepID=UPI001F4FE6CA|nr:DUF4959 domain-containing protein [Pontibacter sp. E15-1]MCJ8164315.1 DUF4959 domain-containing protein [Pontibacter sp. E15-1]